MEIRNVLVPVDFTPTSRHAVDFAVAFARKFRAQLTLLYVAESTKSVTDALPIENDKFRKLRSDEVSGRLTAMLSPEDQDDLDLQVRIRSGSIEAEIRSSIDDELASLVVMGKHHHGLIPRLLFGSLTEDMLRKLPVPVLTVTTTPKARTLSRILFATDLTESSHEGFRFALSLARIAGAKLVVLHSVEPIPLSYGGALPVVDNPAAKRVLIESDRRKLTEYEAEGARQQVVVVSEVREGVASENIIRAAEDSGSDLIVLTIHDKGFVERALLGSTAERVVRDAHVPVLSFPVAVDKDRIDKPGFEGALIFDPFPIP